MHAQVHAKISIEETKSAIFGKEPKWAGVMEQIQTLTGGVTAGKFDLVYIGERTVNDNADDDIDLNGVLESPLGVSFDAAEIVALMVLNKPASGAANQTDLTIGAADAAAWTGLFGATGTVGPLKPGACFLAVAADAAGLGAVTATTDDILRIANSAGAANTYQIAILGRSA